MQDKSAIDGWRSRWFFRLGLAWVFGGVLGVSTTWVIKDMVDGRWDHAAIGGWVVGSGISILAVIIVHADT